MSMSKTAAIAKARGYVGQPIRRSSTDYVVYGPYRVTEPNGPSTELQRSSYPKALSARTEWVAEVALAFMGHGTMLGEVFFNPDHSPWTVEALVEEGLRQIAKAKQLQAA